MNQNQIFIIEPGLVERHYWLDLWRYRELFYVLAWRDVSVRYKQTIIGWPGLSCDLYSLWWFSSRMEKSFAV
jgi:hypothetical protein